MSPYLYNNMKYFIIYIVFNFIFMKYLSNFALIQFLNTTFSDFFKIL